MTRYLLERALFGPLIAEPPPSDLGLAVVVPAKDEGEDLIGSLESLDACDRPDCAVEVIVVVNTGERDPAETIARNTRIAMGAHAWAAEASETGMRFHILEKHGLPRKHAGVGLARKIGMDEACRRLEASGSPQGVIACFDADSRCAANYLVALEALFQRDAACQACSIYFEHPTSGDAYSPEIYDAIIRYELHLRYFINAQRFAGFPFAMQSIGSSMAVRCDAYQEQNGMNRRKAGEDFYFLHKFTPLGHVAELNTTCVMPSPRVSHRVPFGTGKAVGDIVESGAGLTTYSPRSFEDLRQFFSNIEAFFEPGEDSPSPSLPDSIVRYLSSLPVPFEQTLGEIRSGVTNVERFRNRFFRWFNAFAVMKFLHHARDRTYPNDKIEDAARWLLHRTAKSDNLAGIESASALELLTLYRKIDRARRHLL